ncbi:MAG: alginate export family protein, partial [Phycisphaerales bacterium]|nr:alginate export family protein [Phycisphaerales bacterium]
RYWYEFDLRRALDAYQRRSSEFNVNVRVGRQFVDWAGGLALSEALYAVKPTVEFDRRNRLEALVGITPDHTADFDASRLNYNTRTRRFYAGALLAHDFERGDEVFAYALAMRDKASEDRARAGFNNVDFYRDSNYYGLGMKGAMGDNWLYYAEAVLQRGRSASDPLFGLQSRDELTAWAARFQLTYVLRDEGDTRFQFELLAASGDDDRRVGNDTVGGNFPGTEDNAFAALSYAFTGTAFAPALTNLLSLRVGAATFPWRTSDTFHDLQVGADVITSFKVSQRGAIEEPTNPDAYLGTEADVYANWRVTSDLTLTGRYGIFVPGSGIAEPNDNRHFIYLGVTLSF